MKYNKKVAAITKAYTAGSSTYASTVQALLDAYVTKRTPEDSMAPLLSLLGCRNVSYLPNGIDKRFEEPAQPDAIHEELISGTLLKLLRLHMENGDGRDPHNAFAILDGLARNNRWRACLETLSVANDLAALLVDASLSLGGFTPDANSPIYALVEPCIPALYAMLNEWLEPVPAFSKTTLMTEVARAFFGNIWYDLTFGDKSWFDWPEDNAYNPINRAIVASVHKNPPPFRPNLLSASAEERADLPGLEST
jgi:hypothetical protein